MPSDNSRLPSPFSAFHSRLLKSIQISSATNQPLCRRQYRQALAHVAPENLHVNPASAPPPLPGPRLELALQPHPLPCGFAAQANQRTAPFSLEASGSSAGPNDV